MKPSHSFHNFASLSDYVFNYVIQSDVSKLQFPILAVTVLLSILLSCTTPCNISKERNEVSNWFRFSTRDAEERENDGGNALYLFKKGGNGGSGAFS